MFDSAAEQLALVIKKDSKKEKQKKETVSMIDLHASKVGKLLSFEKTIRLWFTISST